MDGKPETLSDSFVVATVNGEDIHALEVNNNLILSEPGILSDPEQLRARQVAIIDELINERLVLQEARRLGIEVSEREIQERLQQQYQAIGKDRIDSFLEENDITLPELKNYIETILIREKVITNLRQRYLTGIQITGEEIEQYYQSNKNQYNVSDVGLIFIEVEMPRGETEEAEAVYQAREIIRLVQQGKDFAALARQYSDDESSRKNGGIIGPINQGISGKLRDIVLSLEPGEVAGEPVNMMNGYAVIKRINEKYLPITVLKEQIKQNLRNQKVRNKIQSHLDSLRADAEIEVFLKK
jgi:parvulin-like peptidyl-prolyl isomerase